MDIQNKIIKLQIDLEKEFKSITYYKIKKRECKKTLKDIKETLFINLPLINRIPFEKIIFRDYSDKSTNEPFKTKIITNKEELILYVVKKCYTYTTYKEFINFLLSDDNHFEQYYKYDKTLKILNDHKKNNKRINMLLFQFNGMINSKDVLKQIRKEKLDAIKSR